MNNFFRTLLAGYGATKLGGGCFSTILIFILIYVALGQCNKQPAHADSITSETSIVVNQVKKQEAVRVQSPAVFKKPGLKTAAIR